MFKAQVGSSTSKDAKTAGKEAAFKAAQGLEAPKAAFIYGSCGYDADAVLAGAAESLPGVPLFGNTSFTGIITPEGFVSSDDGFAGVMVLSDADMKVGAAASARGAAEPFETGAALAEAAMAAAGMHRAPDFFYMAASPAEEEKYLKGISSVIGRVPFFGGSAADNTIEGNWKLYCGDKNFADGVVIAFFYTDVKMSNLFTGAYRETDDFGVITKTVGDRTLAEIDGVPACDKFQSWLGCAKEAVTGGSLLVTCVNSPLGVKDRLGDLIAIRHPMNGNADGSMAVGNKVTEKTCVIRMEATQDELIDSTGDTLKALIAKMPGKPLAFHLVHCGGRRAGIGDRIGEVAKQLKEAAGDVPFIVEFTFGEYGFESDDRNTCGGLMLSFTGFSK